MKHTPSSQVTHGHGLKQTRGLASRTNVAGRFEQLTTEAVDDGWPADAEDEVTQTPTTVTRESAKSILSWNESPDLGFDRSINPFRGCEHGCTYCYARPTHAYLGLSSGLDSTIDRQLARAMEPRASTPPRRLDAIRELSEAGIPVIVNVSPIVPGLTDHEMEQILEQAASAGARYAHYSILRLSYELKDLFKEWLVAERPDRAERVMSLVRQLRGGKENDSRFGVRMAGEGPIAKLLSTRFSLASRRFGLREDIRSLRTDLFKVPPGPGDQLSLL
jgi:DNA repair photolyase